MFFNSFFDKVCNEPNKTAIVCNNTRFTYSEFWNTICTRSISEYLDSDTFLLTSENEIDNLINFFVLIFNGKKAIFSSKSLGLLKKNQILEELNAKDLSHLLPEGNFQNLSNKQFSNKDLFLGVLSSGTTGKPKVIWKDFQSWFSAFDAQSQVFGINDSDVVFIVNALAYSANLNSLLHAFYLGASIILSDISKIGNWDSIFKKEAVSSIFLVPSHYRLLLNENSVFENVRSVISAGEKLDSSTAKLIITAFPNANLTEYYGSAELGHISFQQNKDIIDFPFSVGKPFPGVEIKIDKGIIKVESSYISPQFRGINTNLDYGEWQDGRLVLLGRSGRMFNRRGLNIFAEEIEINALLAPFVFEAAVVQDKDNSKIHLFFSVKENFKGPYKNELYRFLLNHLPSSKLPNFIIQLEEIPHTESGKINFSALSKKMDEEEIVELNV